MTRTWLALDRPGQQTHGRGFLLWQKPRAEFSIPTTITTTTNASMNCVAHIILLNYGTFATLEQKTVIHST
jgi:hypothetical protein